MTPNEIAADVARRYGVTVNPAVVQILPARVPVEPDCYWCEKTQQLLNRENGRETFRKQIKVQTDAAKAARNEGAARHRAALKADKQHRVEALRKFGATANLHQLAQRMGVLPHTAERYAKDNNINYLGKPQPRQASKAELTARRAKVLELHKAGLSAPKISEGTGLSFRQVRRDLEAML